ncbi:MAG: hypothetical protein GDA67_16725 [Nitrospira sp. CR1.3]|nr:hypothetical protein [Nitrospira sp. CR1.3]
MVDVDGPGLEMLRFVALYRVGTRTAFATLLGSKSEPDGRLATLVKHKLLQVHRGLPGNRSVYQLGPRGAAEVGVSAARARMVGSQSLIKNLGVLLFCQVPESNRHRVEIEQLFPVFGRDLPEGAYCVGRVKDRVVVFDCYVPGPQTPIATVARRLGQRLRAVKKNSALDQAIRDKRFGFAVIVHTSRRRKAIMDAVRTAKNGHVAPLISRVRIWVEVVVALATVLGIAEPVKESVHASLGPTLEFGDSNPDGSGVV